MTGVQTCALPISSHLEISDEIINRKPSPDTWNFEVSDEDFFFGLPYRTMDLILYASENNISPEIISVELGVTLEQLERIMDDQKKKWKSSQHMREMPPRIKPNIVLSYS